MERKTIHVVPTFHYDVVYLKGYEEYVRISCRILEQALEILAQSPDYTFLVEQVILLEEFWARHPECRDPLRRFAAEGRLVVAPGMFVMPDLNHTDGESLFRQARLGREWLEQHLGLVPDCCWIADCWGHHAQLPQILTQAGYRVYVFWRCMRPEVQVRHFHWEGLDGTRIRTHWLARGYSNLQFPGQSGGQNAADLNLRGWGLEKVARLAAELRSYGPGPLLICNGGDFVMPQPSAPAALAALNQAPGLPPLAFSTPSAYAAEVDWAAAPVVTGEFNSNLQGTFASNIALKQRTRLGVGRALDVEALESVTGARSTRLADAWRLLLKLQFHDSICGTICDEALAGCLTELDRAEALLSEAAAELAGREGGAGWFNGLAFPRTELVEDGDRLRRVEVGPFGTCSVAAAPPLPSPEPAALPLTFSTPFYRATVGGEGFLTGLTDPSGRELVRPEPCPFGSLALQMDYGDLWLNFEAPLNGGCLSSALTRNVPDPYDRGQPDDIANHSTFRPVVRAAHAVRMGDVVEVVQRGTIGFWQLQIAFETRLRLSASSPRLEYRTTIQPAGRHYRLRAAFPTTLRQALPRHEIPFGLQARGPHEHAAQNWIDLQDDRGGVALLNRGIPGNNADDGVLLLTLFRAAAMEYKAPSRASFNEGVPHAFEYAVLPHGPGDDGGVVRQAMAFTRGLLRLPSIPATLCSGWALDSDTAFLSTLRPTPHGVFARVYEATGRPATARVRVPDGIREFALADGLERPAGPFQPCAGAVTLALRPFEIRGLLLRP